MLPDDDRDIWPVLEEKGTRLMHFPDANGLPRCGYGGEVTALNWPTYAAAVWCTGCFQASLNAQGEPA